MIFVSNFKEFYYKFMVFNECKVVDEGLMNIMFVFFLVIKLKILKIIGFFLLYDFDSI